MLRKMLIGIAWIWLIGGFIGVTVVRFARPELTETQLFLNLWMVESQMILGAAFIALDMRMRERRVAK